MKPKVNRWSGLPLKSHPNNTGELPIQASIGPSVSLPIFAQVRNRTNLQRSRSIYEEAVARYRQQVLVAFGEVENSLSAIQFLSEQAAAQDRAVASAERAADLAMQRYKAGIVSYLEVVDANRATFVTHRARAQLSGERLTASIQLVKALGGGWTEGELYTLSKSETKAEKKGLKERRKL